jgi:hypothetical protein
MATLKLVKIGTYPNCDEIITYLIGMLKESETGALTEEINLPTSYFFVIEDNGVIMPAYILCDRYEALVLWVHKSCRGKGYGKFMVSNRDIRYAVVLESAIPFWLKIGFRRVDNSFSSGPVRVRKIKRK